MKISSIILVALICGVTFAADTPTCSGYLSNTCNTTNCQFTPDTNGVSFCTSKCFGFTAQDDCQNSASNCSYQASKCLPKATDCELYNKDKATCTNHNNACQFSVTKCTPNDDLTNKCKAFTNYATCSAPNTNCLFNATGAISCVAKTDLQCDNVCANPNGNCSFGTCSNPNTCNTLAEADCKGTCSWNAANKACEDACASQTDAVKCNALGCKNVCNNTAQTTCQDLKTDALCVANTNCVSQTQGTCGANQDACNIANCDLNNCDSTGECSASECPGDANNCGPNCFQLPATCVPKSATQCLNSIKDASNCESQGCVFSQVGTCSTKSSNSVIIIFSLLSSLIALMF
ncbi:hypothetical protein TTHERM_00554590 (macronuclear) [Tetrahymena thermophila SB210]|uniref:Transmembrane protein n=1 Tax=Tetrahymena thermophila (strain SB210) TaxID=312017 RepID=Q22UG6_TETTS|nr:hypothetical protein TTHERM_00554590 [Tetrahymena thermophila SB210]EAR89004.3 hypothetical protein TTHERM_00554590 [Tetrahymena thermophila SB210]|eukprot:XP_001009249.3 hypothetical protein TTHERM_00554590 [Tetrahymena thermophila SB210]